MFDAVSQGAPVRFSLDGMPGIGKSQLALQYAYTAFNRRRYAVIFWISATTIEKLYQGFMKILHLVHHSDRDHPNQSVQLLSARRWLEEATIPWLIVLDNASINVVDFFREHLPRQNSNGNILFTTRTKEAAEALVRTPGRHNRTLTLKTLAIHDATQLLLMDAGLDMTDTTKDEVKEAEDLVKSIGCLPLAVNQAGAFIQQSGHTVGTALGLYKSEHKANVSHSPYIMTPNAIGD